MLMGLCTVAQGAGDVDVPDSSPRASPWGSNYWGPTSFISLIASVPLIIIPYWLVPSPMFVPKRRSQRGVVGSRAVMTLSLLTETPPFIGPTGSLLVNCITRDRYVTSGFYTSYTIIIGSLVPSSLRPFVPLYKYNI